MHISQLEPSPLQTNEKSTDKNTNTQRLKLTEVWQAFNNTAYDFSLGF